MKSIRGKYFDTINTITADCGETELREAMISCEYYENLFSKKKAGSDVYRLNHSDGRPVAVSMETLEVLKCAKRMYMLTEGAYSKSAHRISCGE